MSATPVAPACGYCGTGIYHIGLCPRIKEIEYHPNGTVKRVVLTTPAPHPPTNG